MYIILFNRKKCTGCSYCADLMPEMWTINNSDGKADLFESDNLNGIFRANIIDDEYKQNIEISKLCPAKIIEIKKN